MLRNTLILVFLFALYLPGTTRGMETNTPSTALQGKVSWIYDGDTIEVEPHGKVRLIGIDCPEREASERDNKFVQLGANNSQFRRIYKKALQFNIEHAKGQTVSLTLDSPSRDRHGRLLVYVYLPDGRLLNQLLLEEGLAIVYRRFDFQMKQAFLTAEQQARETRRGLWK